MFLGPLDMKFVFPLTLRKILKFGLSAYKKKRVGHVETEKVRVWNRKKGNTDIH